MDIWDEIISWLRRTPPLSEKAKTAIAENPNEFQRLYQQIKVYTPEPGWGVKAPTYKPRQVEMRPATGQERPVELPPYQPDITGKLPSDVYGWLAKVPSYAHPYETGVAAPVRKGILEWWPAPEPTTIDTEKLRTNYPKLYKDLTDEQIISSFSGGLYGLPSATKQEKIRQMVATEIPSLPLWVMPIGGEAKTGKVALEQVTKGAEKQLAKTTAKYPEVFDRPVEEVLSRIDDLTYEQLRHFRARLGAILSKGIRGVETKGSERYQQISNLWDEFNTALKAKEYGLEKAGAAEEAGRLLRGGLQDRAKAVWNDLSWRNYIMRGDFPEAVPVDTFKKWNGGRAPSSTSIIQKGPNKGKVPTDIAADDMLSELGYRGTATKNAIDQLKDDFDVLHKLYIQQGGEVFKTVVTRGPRTAKMPKSRRGIEVTEIIPEAPVMPPVEAQRGVTAEKVSEGVGGMKPPPKPPPTTVAPTPPVPPTGNAVQKVQGILPTIKKLTSEYAEKLHKVRSQRLGAAKGAGEVAGGGEKGLYAELGQLKGKVEKPTFTPTYDKYTQGERDELFNLIDKFEFKDGLGEVLPHQGYTRIEVKRAFRDILDGVKPTPQNFKYLEQVFGKEAMKPLLKFMSPKWGEYVTELFYNSILSNPKTHIVNFVSNTLTAVMSPFEKGVSALVEVPLALIQRRPRQRFFGEVAQEIFGVLRGIPEGVRAAFKTLKSGQTVEQLSKWEQRTEAFKGKAAIVIKLPTRFLEAADAFGRGINRMMALRAQAYRVASKEGLKGEKFLARLNELMMNPTEEMLEEASRIAEYRLFRQEPGAVVSKLMKLRDAEVWGIQPLRFIIPFLRTPANLVKFGLERSPLAVFNVPMWKNVAQKSPEAAEQIARWVMGSSIAATIGIYAADGKITGAAPKNTLERDAFYRAGKQPYSVKIGDVWIAYQRLEPFNQVLAQVAAIVGAINDKKSKDDIFNQAQQVVSTIGNNLISQTYMSGIANLIGAFEDPVGEGEYLLQQLSTGFIPYSGLMRGLSQAVEPTYRKPSNIPETIMTAIPGMAGKVKPRTNIFGEVSKRTTPWYSPFNISPERQTDLDKELERLGITIGYPSSIIGTTKLDEQQIYEYRNFVGQALMRELSTAIESSTYKRLGSDVAKSDYIDRVIRDTRADAREEFAEMVGISMQTERQQRTPTATPSMVPEREKVPTPSNIYTPGYLPRRTQTTPSAPGTTPKRKLPTLGSK